RSIEDAPAKIALGHHPDRHTAVGVAARDEEAVPSVHLHEAVLDVPIVGVGFGAIGGKLGTAVGSVDVDPVVTKSLYVTVDDAGAAVQHDPARRLRRPFVVGQRAWGRR